jgi:hypothetical protein
MFVSPYGIASATTPAHNNPWGTSPYGQQGISLSPHASQQGYSQPFTNALSNPTSSINQLGGPPLHQVFQLLQVIPQQLQQLQQLVFTQQQQLQQVQQFLQLIPGQLVQLQQLIQLVPQQLQQLSASQLTGYTGFGVTPPLAIAPQAFAQPGLVM